MKTGEGHQHQACRSSSAVIGGGVEPDVLPVDEQGQHEDQEHHVLGEALPGREAAARRYSWRRQKQPQSVTQVTPQVTSAPSTITV